MQHYQCINFMFDYNNLISYDHGVELQAVPLFDLNLHDESITEKTTHKQALLYFVSIK